MLEQMRSASQSLIIYVLFGIIIAVFIVSFGPQSSAGCEGGGAGTFQVARVEGQEITPQDWRYGALLGGEGQMSPEEARARRMKEGTMDRLIERALLARSAEELGFHVSNEEVEDMLVQSKIIGLGYEQKLTFVEKEGRFDYDLFRRFVQFELGMSPRVFIEQQKREMMAARVRELLKAGVTVSRDEVQSDFVRRGHQVNVEFVRFPARWYEAGVAVTDETVKAYAAAHQDVLKKTYAERKFLYEKAPKERKLRHILVRVEAVTATPDAGAGAATADQQAEAAEKKMRALAVRIRKGTPLATVAKVESDDAQTRSREGLLGWKREGTTMFGADIDKQVWAAAEGALVGPVKGPEGWHLIAVEGTRAGDISFQDAQLELAEERMRKDMAKERAKTEAGLALAKAHEESQKNLQDLFPGDANLDADKPRAEETGLFARQGAVNPVLGPSPPRASLVFALKTEAPFGGPVEVAGSYVIVKVKERKTPDMADFKNRERELVQETLAVKGEDVVMKWVERRCQDAKKARAINVNKDLIRYGEGPEGAVAYEPCASPFR
jgi:peptidyl-prolyl cis-trans isomerase D